MDFVAITDKGLKGVQRRSSSHLNEVLLWSLPRQKPTSKSNKYELMLRHHHYLLRTIRNMSIFGGRIQSKGFQNIPRSPQKRLIFSDQHSWICKHLVSPKTYQELFDIIDKDKNEFIEVTDILKYVCNILGQKFPHVLSSSKEISHEDFTNLLKHDKHTDKILFKLNQSATVILKGKANINLYLDTINSWWNHLSPIGKPVKFDIIAEKLYFLGMFVDVPTSKQYINSVLGNKQQVDKKEFYAVFLKSILKGLIQELQKKYAMKPY